MNQLEPHGIEDMSPAKSLPGETDAERARRVANALAVMARDVFGVRCAAVMVTVGDDAAWNAAVVGNTIELLGLFDIGKESVRTRIIEGQLKSKP